MNPNVLIPRFETEELVENVLNYIRYEFSDAKRVIDLGCGSGAIGLTIKKKMSRIGCDVVRYQSTCFGSG